MNKYLDAERKARLSEHTENTNDRSWETTLDDPSVVKKKSISDSIVATNGSAQDSIVSRFANLEQETWGGNASHPLKCVSRMPRGRGAESGGQVEK